MQTKCFIRRLLFLLKQQQESVLKNIKYTLLQLEIQYDFFFFLHLVHFIIFTEFILVEYYYCFKLKTIHFKKIALLCRYLLSLCSYSQYNMFKIKIHISERTIANTINENVTTFRKYSQEIIHFLFRTEGVILDQDVMGSRQTKAFKIVYSSLQK